ncbi:UvrD-helicase domain-containing protein [Halobacteriovorax sp. JY17]|uniref:UvrD-helicase domain-containing protein n=1 Tax=Halobacteriovorax sp. JY17 TaxID=2014617 RepID=UPI0025C64378|nr:UvrD-helicase domain-containing protein [Halobacteriovorax sp. JY17]
MREPNSEQKLAIEHTGGVLLSAGAGSGKTFVLVEHVIYLAKRFINQNENIDLIEFEQKIQSYFSKIVLMTFTKKAAGEIYERLVQRIEVQIESTQDNLESWLIIKNAVDFMTISTIHGFCYKLIGQGLIPGVSSSVGIISESEYREKISKLYERWFENHLEEIPSEEFRKIISLNSSQITKSMLNIFGSPEIRLMWKDLKFENLEKDSSEIWPKIWELLGVDELWNNPIDLIPFSEFSDKPWFQVIQKIQNKYQGKTQWKLEDFEFSIEMFDGISRLTGPSKKIITNELEEHFSLIKEFRGFLKKYTEDITQTFTSMNEDIKKWWESTHLIYQYIEKHYRDIPGVTFSDLEYYVSLSLCDEETRKNIAHNYEYFIVDEFQDTSEVQFEMLSQIIDGDFHKLFTVGDMKQAIYGFRGGELGVFKSCMEKSPQTLKLSNNYRSKANIIDFNNYVFDYLFKIGLNFEGIDNHSVPVDYQTFPFEKNSENSGKVVVSNYDIGEFFEEKEKPKSEDFSLFESKSFLTQIEDIFKNTDENVCVLYKNLGPSKYLINELIKNDLSFTAQIKVPLAEDPILAIFKTLVDFLLSSEEEEDVAKLKFYLSGYFNLLNLSISETLEEVVKQFVADTLTLGVYNSFLKFSFSAGLLNSNHKNNGQIVKELCEMCGDDLEQIQMKIFGYSDVKYSIDFEYGKDAKRIQIMTAHASKGLEFDNVFIGGIHNNGRTMPEMSFFGKLPWSFKWKKDSRQKTAYATPTFIYEGLLYKKKDFAESKRLFYVASTRAQKNLYWTDLSLNGEPLQSAKNSWICGLRKWQEEDLIKKIDFMEVIKDNQRNIEGLDVEFVKLKAPLFHMDSLGVTSAVSNDSSLGIISELSVTRLASISQCPRKFYLLNVCKFTEEDVVELTGKESVFSGIKASEIIEEEGVISSSASRGTEIHEALSFAIKRNWIAPASFIDKNIKKDIAAFDWTISKLKEKSLDYNFISEEMIKFPFFEQMISGTPDLVLTPKESGNQLEVWDFKTGQREEAKEVPYWFQLKSYAYAYQVLYPEFADKPVKLVLSFADMQENVEVILTHQELKESLHKDWELTSKPDLINQDHCKQCTFGNLCHF